MDLIDRHLIQPHFKMPDCPFKVQFISSVRGQVLRHCEGCRPSSSIPLNAAPLPHHSSTPPSPGSRQSFTPPLACAITASLCI